MGEKRRITEDYSSSHQRRRVNLFRVLTLNPKFSFLHCSSTDSVAGRLADVGGRRSVQLQPEWRDGVHQASPELREEQGKEERCGADARVLVRRSGGRSMLIALELL